MSTQSSKEAKPAGVVESGWGKRIRLFAICLGVLVGFSMLQSCASDSGTTTTGSLAEAPEAPPTDPGNPEGTSTACDSVDIFAVNIVSGNLTCSDIAPIAQAYVDAMNASDTFGSDSIWVDDSGAWTCALDRPEGQLADEDYGLLCVNGDNEFTLNSGDTD